MRITSRQQQSQRFCIVTVFHILNSTKVAVERRCEHQEKRDVAMLRCMAKREAKRSAKYQSSHQPNTRPSTQTGVFQHRRLMVNT